MIDQSKKISPQAITSLKEALSVIYWTKKNLRTFLKITLTNSAILTTIDWDSYKRSIVNELIDRMINNPKLYQEDLMNLLIAVTDFTDFEHLNYWDENGSKKKKAKQAVEHLRKQTKGYIEITKEKEQARNRKIEVEKRIAKSQSLEKELNDLKLEFFKISSNKNLQERGYQLETFLNKLFHLFDLDPKGSFKNFGEQIDGAFTFDNNDYLLEAKWKKQVDRTDLSSFSTKVESKLKVALGLFVTIEGLTKEAIAPQFNSIIVMDGSDLMAVLESRVTLPDLLYKKRRKAAETGEIFVSFFNL